MSLLLLTLPLLSINVIFGDYVSLDLVHLDSTKYPLALCNDGSTAGFYFKKSPTSSSLWLVHLEGGGWCWDNDSCSKRKHTAPQLTTNKLWRKSILKTGIFDDDPSNNPLYDANKVFVPYCTSDGWMGFKMAENENNHWFFMGQQVIESVLNTLISDPLYGLGETPNVDTLAFSGCSAGGRGAMVNLDYIPGIIKGFGVELKSIFGILDSALYINVQPLRPYSSSTSLGNQTMNVYSFQNCSGRVIGSQCGDHYTEDKERWKCLFGEYKMPFLEVDHVINAAQYDSYQMGVDLGGSNVNKYDEEQREYAEDPFRSTMRKVVLENITSNIVSTACFHHCTSEQDNFWKITTNGVSFAEMLRKYINGEERDKGMSNKWIGNCTNGINCGSGCV